MTAVQVLIADDHRLVRHGLAQLLATDALIEVVGMVGDGAEAIASVAAQAPDLVLMDLSMPVLDGIEATRQIKVASPDVRVLVLSSHGDEDHVTRALAAGADGYVLKHGEPEELLRAIHDAMAGGLPLSPMVGRVMLESQRRAPTPPSNHGVHLTQRESQVLQLVAKGSSNQQIAARLGIAERTVKSHVSSLFQRIGVSDRVNAARWASEHLSVS
jgi:DNA-binding NarL/FixJ family response regulator